MKPRPGFLYTTDEGVFISDKKMPHYKNILDFEYWSRKLKEKPVENVYKSEGSWFITKNYKLKSAIESGQPCQYIKKQGKYIVTELR